MTIVTGVPAPANRGEDAAAESPCGSPEPGLAIVPLGVVPLTAGYLLQATEGRDDGRARCYPVSGQATGGRRRERRPGRGRTDRPRGPDTAAGAPRRPPPRPL